MSEPLSSKFKRRLEVTILSGDSATDRALWNLCLILSEIAQEPSVDDGQGGRRDSEGSEKATKGQASYGDL